VSAGAGRGIWGRGGLGFVFGLAAEGANGAKIGFL